MRLLLQRILTIGISPVLCTWFGFIVEKNITFMQIFVLIFAIVSIILIGVAFIIDDEPYLQHLLFKTKIIYTEYGTFYLVKKGKYYYLNNLHWYGYEKINWYNLGKIDQGLIGSINNDIKQYAEKNKMESIFEKELDDSWKKWDGITDQRLRRNKKIDSII